MQSKTSTTHGVIRPLCVLATLMITTLASHATVYFNNKGNTAGWDTVNQQNNGTVKNVTTFKFKGAPTSIEATCNFRPNSTTRFHSEVIKRNVGQPGQDRYYGFAFLLGNSPDGWKVGSNHVITQIASDNGAWFGMGVSSGKLSGIPVAQGVWHRVVVHIKWATDNTGIKETWVDGTKTSSQRNIQAWPGKPPRWSLGLYEPFWHNAAGITPGLEVRKVYVGGARITSSFREADPSTW